MKTSTAEVPMLTIGLDLGKRYSRFFALAATGEVVAEERISTTWEKLEKRFAQFEPATVIIEAGALSVWVKAALELSVFLPLVLLVAFPSLDTLSLRSLRSSCRTH